MTAVSKDSLTMFQRFVLVVFVMAPVQQLAPALLAPVLLGPALRAPVLLAPALLLWMKMKVEERELHLGRLHLHTDYLAPIRSYCILCNLDVVVQRM